MRDYEHYIYYHSDAIGLDYCHAKDGSHIWTSDGVRYGIDEIKAIHALGEIDPQVHAVKKIMEGTIVRCEAKKMIVKDIF